MSVRENGKWMAKPDSCQKVYWLEEGTECKIGKKGETIPEKALMRKPEGAESAGSWVWRLFK